MAVEPPTLSALFLLGLFGTGHCVGMCGPLVVAFPGATGRPSAHLFYHLGRMTTYVAVGALMGGAGAGLRTLAGAAGADPLVWTARTQVAISAAAAGMLLFFGLFRLGLMAEPEWMAVASPSRLPGFRRILGAATEGGRAAMVGLGLLMGFLPCGLSYAAFARALAAGGIGAGGLFLLAFGAGTVPGLLAVGLGASGLALRYRRHMEVLSGMVLLGMGLSLGMDALGTLLL